MIEGYNDLNENIVVTTKLIADVASASKEQQLAMSQINDTVNSLDQATQENAALASTINDMAAKTSNLVTHLQSTINQTSFDRNAHKRVCDTSLIIDINRLKSDHINFKNTIIAMLIVGVYLSLATACMIYMLWHIFKTDKEKELLMYRSHTDELTGCFNRHAYEEDIVQLRMDEAFVYISLDMNGLKTVNDSLGHAAGDELIRGVASCMKQCFAEVGKVYRIGGDEFVIIVLDQTQNIENIRETFDKNVRRWQGKMVKDMSVSCGYVSSDEKEWDTNYDIAKAADARMYENKAAYYQKSGRDRRKR